jgi:glycosyltransferase 2 family protein
MHSRLPQIWIGLAGALLFLTLALARAPLAAVAAIMAHSDPIWLGEALGAYVVALSLRARRWQLILRSVAALRCSTVARALLVGCGMNTIMPARLGELFRAEFCTRTTGLPRASVLTSIVVERLFDGLAVVACLASGLVFCSGRGRPAAALADAAVAGAVLFGGVLILVFLIGRLPSAALEARWPCLSAPLAAVRRGAAVLHDRRGLQTALLTVIVYVPEALSVWLVVKAAGFTLAFADTLALVGAASLVSLLPSGPAFLGPLQFAYALAVEFAGGEAATGIAAATLAQLCILLPVAIAAAGVLLGQSGNALFARFAGTAPSRTLEHPLRPVPVIRPVVARIDE